MRSQPPLEGQAAPPRNNGELVFQEPWQARAFGLCLNLVEDGIVTWSEFQKELIRQIEADGAQPQTPPENGPAINQSYYRSWLAALEHLITTKQLLEADVLDSNCQQLASRPHGHDH